LGEKVSRSIRYFIADRIKELRLCLGMFGWFLVYAGTAPMFAIHYCFCLIWAICTYLANPDITFSQSWFVSLIATHCLGHIIDPWKTSWPYTVERHDEILSLMNARSDEVEK
jgi:hypothetical protein